MNRISLAQQGISANLAVRAAQPEDAAAIAALYRLLTGNPAVNVTPERLRAIAAHDDHHLLAAEMKGKVCGTIMLTFCMDAMFGEQPFTVVENVIVDPECRGCGIGAALFAQAETMSIARMSSKIMLLSAAERTDAHAFFERIGYAGDKKRGFIKYRRQFS